MTDISDSLYFFGELGMQEFESTKLLKDTLEAAGFKVELGGAGMPTNLWAEWGTGHPKIAIVTEVDALPGGSQTPGEFDRKPMVKDGPGHMEGHNTHGGVASAAAFAVKQVMQRDKIPGTIAISFGPAEEQLASRPFIVRAGYFKDVDAIIYLHIRDTLNTTFGIGNYAAISSIFTFHGKTAHGAVNPWEGKDAVDAIELMDIGFDKLREHLRPTYRAHRSIMFGGIQPNIIPDKGVIWWFVRDASMPAAKATYDKLLKIAEGAALMTGTTYDVKYSASAWPQLVNKTIAEAIQKNVDMVGMPKWTERGAAARQGLPEAVRKAGDRAAHQRHAARRSSAGRVLQRQRRRVLGRARGQPEFPVGDPGHRSPRVEGGRVPDELDLAQGAGGGGQGAGRLAHRSADSAGACCRRRAPSSRWNSKKTPYFSLVPADAQPRHRTQPRGDGEISPRDAQALSEQDAAVQLRGGPFRRGRRAAVA